MIFALTILLVVCSLSEAFSAPNNSAGGQQPPPPLPTITDAVSRRNLLWQAPLGAFGFCAYGRLAYEALCENGMIEYPAAHEERVASTLQVAITAAAAAASSSTQTRSSLLRVLEVGIGTEARLIRRGLYDSAIHQLSGKVDRLELTGLDVRLPTNTKVLNDASGKLNVLGTKEGTAIDLHLIKSSICTKTQFPDGYFDCIICCLTLCSVEDPAAALSEMKRLLRPNGGTVGYVEHVAVGAGDEGHKFLDWQQQLLDPLQQLAADNCHLHRYTDRAIAHVFFQPPHGSRYLQQERFYVNSMWPVSCQSCGVVQLV